MILGISGKKQAGKTTIANIIYGDMLLKNKLIFDYNISEKDKLIINTTNANGDKGWGEFDIERKDEEFIEYAHYNIWPFVKLYNFAEPVKDMCINLFGLTYEQAYGTNKQKEEKLKHLLWKNMPRSKVSRKAPKGEMSAREFMQFFGTEVMRKIHPDVWANACLNKISREGSDLAIIADVRFPNEVEAINKIGGKVLRLERDVHEDNHDSETALDADKFDHSNFWRVLDNKEMTIGETITEVKSLLEQV